VQTVYQNQLFIALSMGEDGRINPTGLGSQKSPGRFVQCAAGGQHVIDQQD
jgi:hypothetical protein